MWIQSTIEIEILYIIFYLRQFKGKISEFRFEKTVEKTYVFLEESYVTELSLLRIRGREELTPKKSLKSRTPFTWMHCC